MLTYNKADVHINLELLCQQVQNLYKLDSGKSQHSEYGRAEIPPLVKEILTLFAYGKGESISSKDVICDRSTIYLGRLYTQEYLGTETVLSEKEPNRQEIRNSKVGGKGKSVGVEGVGRQ